MNMSYRFRHTVCVHAHTYANKWKSIYSFLAIHSNKDQDISRKRLNATGWIPFLNPHFSNISWKRKFQVTTCWTAHPSQRTIIWSSRTTVTFPVDTTLPDPDSCMTLTCTVRYSQDCIWIGWSNPRPPQQTLLNTSLFALISWTAADLRETALLRYPGLARRGGGGRKKRRGREELHLSFIFFFFKLTALLGKAMCCFRLHMCVNGRGRSGLVVAALSEGWSDASFWREGASAAAYRLPVFTCAFRRLGNIFIISAPASAAQFSKELLNGKKWSLATATPVCKYFKKHFNIRNETRMSDNGSEWER